MGRKVILWIGRPIIWLHESLHLVAARLVGIEARLSPDGTVVWLKNLSAHRPLAVAFVTLAPALIGLLALAAVLRA